MTSSWAGEEIAARTFISFPQEGQRVGSSSQTFAMRRAQFRFRTRTNSHSSPSMTVVVGLEGGAAGFLIQPSLLRTVVERAP